MFERFTDRARRAVVLAQDEARSLNYDHIGTEQLLVGLLRDDEGIAAVALSRLDITLDAVRAQIADLIGPGNDLIMGHIPFTRKAKKVLELALREAMELGHNYIGTEHLLLGIAREGEGVAAQVLVKLGVSNMDALREVVRSLIAQQGVVSHYTQPTHAPHVQVVVYGRPVRIDQATAQVIARAAEHAGTENVNTAHLKQALEELGAT